MHPTSPRPLVLLGATGSIGRSTVDLVRRYPDRFRIVGASTHRRADDLVPLARDFGIGHLAVVDAGAREAAARNHADLGAHWTAPGGEGLLELIEACPGALVVNGVVGAAGLAPTVHALERGHDVALANKEALVVGGHLVLEAAERGQSTLWPVDSEHSAIAQCLRGNPAREVHQLWLTASGGPFRDRDPRTFGEVTLAEVLRHPTWDMGPKITVDSATMMNKGLEILEAHLLFGTPLARIQVVVHRQSIVHSMVEFVDGAFLAQLGEPDMRLPILYALTGGEHVEADVAPFDPVRAGSLTFEAPDPARYPCLDLARQAAAAGGAASIVLNAANEEAVAALLREAVSFEEIPRLIEHALAELPLTGVASVSEALDRDELTRRHTRQHVARRSRTKA
jgi:1-deoxy-D-xylulose-5-phosphate reductoisomerase